MDTAASPQVPVLMYHSVASRATPDFREFVTEPAAFRDHMAALVGGGYEPTTVSGYMSRPTNGSGKPVVLTFDDAFQDFHTTVLPILTELGLPATLYVPTACVGETSRWLDPEGEADRPMMSWGAVAEAAASGVEIGSHSRTHPQLDLVAKDRMRSEIHDSRSELEDRLQCEVLTFAYPFGYHNAAVRDAVGSAGYQSACAVRDLASTTLDPFAISRWTVRHGTDAAALLELLDARSGLVDELRSEARAQASRALRRLGVKRPVRAQQGDGRVEVSD
jgi:peptidoglycan/xylan/chitin deacetylase (PgdA/CDA1 family)